jgi:hypothetical protein
VKGAIGVLLDWEACGTCLHATEDGDSCGRDCFSVDGESVVCDCYETEEDAKERAAELREDCKRDEGER